jgi:hypothetical protein
MRKSNLFHHSDNATFKSEICRMTIFSSCVAEQTGIIDIIAVNSSGEQIKQEMQLNHMSVIPNESDTDTGYTADTEDDSVLKVGNDSISTYH